jgi:exonuclease SbcC
VTLHRAYNEIPSLLFEEAIPYIEQYTNEILEKVSPGKRVQLRSFKDTKAGTQTKSLDVVGMTATGNRDFDNLSGSEKFRQSLALRIAIARYNKERNNVTIDFFVVDEGFGSLDAENRVQAKAALKDIASRFDLFLIITHVEELKDTFDNKILINPQVKT